MDVPYSEQLHNKDIAIREIYAGLCGKSLLDEMAIKPIIGTEDPYHYRDKVTSPFVGPKKALRANGKSIEGRQETLKPKKHASKPHGRGPAKSKGQRTEVITGIYARNSHMVVPVKDCLLENRIASKVIDSVRSIMEKHGIEPYDEDTGRGFMRNVVVRVGHRTDEVLVTLVTNSDEFPHSKSFCKELIARVPECTSIVQNINTRQTNVILGERFRKLYGPGFILDELCGLSFRISPGAFYQVNSTQTEVLYRKAIEMAAIEEGDCVLDAYCGTGTIGLVACKERSNPLLGLDSSTPAIADARMNAKHNGIENAVFITEDATEFMQGLAVKPNDDERLEGFDLNNLIAFLDPPRSGATEEFLDALACLSPKRIVYISCNPKTQARDCKMLCDIGYEIAELQPVDMFPHTPHIESIALLERRSGE